MIKLPLKIRFEQAVYGSFPFWRRGYALLSQSAGCRSEWLSEMRTVCQRHGEAPAGTVEAESLFAVRLKSGPWMIVGVHPQGCDDQGRPGALAFHALFVGRWAYQWAGANPFAFAGAMRRDWTLADSIRPLTAAAWYTRGNRLASSSSEPAADDDPRTAPIVRALKHGRRVVVQSNEPIDQLARAVWRMLPRSVRRRATVATWAFDNANQFDLVSLPKLAGATLDASALIIALEYAGQ
jgi:hypothetical protein